MALHITCACPTPIKGLGCIVICVKCEGGNAKTPQLLCLPHAHKGVRPCLTWVRGWVGVRPPPPRGGGHLSVCGYAKILGGWVLELTSPPGVGKQNLGRGVLHDVPKNCQNGTRTSRGQKTDFARNWEQTEHGKQIFHCKMQLFGYSNLNVIFSLASKGFQWH